jgi:hypothetical protein
LKISENQNLRIVPVTQFSGLSKFINLPWSIYKNDPYWRPPLKLERRLHLSSFTNPYFKHAKVKYWLAYRGTTAVGRISAQIDQLTLQQQIIPTGFFGMLEAIDDEAVFKILFDTAETWLRLNGVKKVRGPFSLSINQESGLLIKGFHQPPMFMMGHAPTYYAQRIEALTYSKVKDLYAWRITPHLQTPETIKYSLNKVTGRVTLRSFSKKHLNQDLLIMRDIFNDAWSENWGFIPFTEEEFLDMGKTLVKLIDTELIKIVELDENPVAMIVMMPDINELFQELNGSLFPFGWIRLIQNIKKHAVKNARVPLMGVKKAHQKSLAGSALAFMLIDAVHKMALQYNFNFVELSWVLEDNYKLNNLIQYLGGTKYKTYRVYEKEID